VDPSVPGGRLQRAEVHAVESREKVWLFVATLPTNLIPDEVRASIPIDRLSWMKLLDTVAACEVTS
jgi:hypothetical protein